MFVRNSEKDTLYIYKDRVKVRTIITPDTVFQSVNIPPQTIRDTVEVHTQEVKTVRESHLNGYWLVVVLFAIIGIVAVLRFNRK